MTERICPNCGTPEQRTTDAQGHPQVNLSPITGQCVDCLAAMAKEVASMQAAQPELAFDARMKAANDGD